MILIITLLIAFAFLMFFRFRNVSLYKNNYSDTGFLSMNVRSVQLYNALHTSPNNKPLEISYNFFNFTANLILKVVLFAILATVKYIFRGIPIVGIILCGIYSFFVVSAWLVYKGRRTFFNDIPELYKKAFEPIMKASLCIPAFQTIIGILLLLVV